MFKKEKLITLKFYTDPGHGWVAVKRKMLYDLGIAGKISYFSFEKGQTVYLEEDKDLATLLDALGERGFGVKLNEKHTDGLSPIRSYNRYFA